MKYIKLYEHRPNQEDINNSEKYYWLVYNDKYRLKKQLQNINCPKSTIANFLTKLKEYDENILYAGVTLDPMYYRWEMDHRDEYFSINGYEYKGPVELTAEELE